MNKTKMWHVMAAFAIVAFFVTAAMPDSLVMAAPVNGGTQYSCACSCGTTNGKPLNFNELSKNVQDFTSDLQELEKLIKEKKKLLLELYKKTKEGILWKEIEDLEVEISELEGLYTQKRDALFEMEVLQKYTELQKDGTLKIKAETLPQIEDLDLEGSSALNVMEWIAREKMENKLKIRELIFGKNYWEKKNWKTMAKEFVKVPELDVNELERVYKEQEDIEGRFWEARKNYLEISLIQTMRGELTRGSSILLIQCLPSMCPAKAPKLISGNSYYLTSFTQERVWVGLYSSDKPNRDSHLGYQYDKCPTVFTTDMTYYWNIAKSDPIVGYKVRSIQIKWFYQASHGTYRRTIIWEGNKSILPLYGEWYTYGKYTKTSPLSGWYQVGVFANANACCYYTSTVCKWCNTHCGLCFACDPSADQNFSLTDTR